MTDPDLDRIKSDPNLLRAVVGRNVNWSKDGKRWKCCCPFHNEPGPSFTVYPEGRYHCFGCGAHGTIIDYFMRKQGVEVGEAIRLAKQAAGVADSQPKRPNKPNGPAKNGDAEVIFVAVIPPPKDAPPAPTAEINGRYRSFEYVTDRGEHHHYQRRVQMGAKKAFFPLTYGTLTKHGRSGVTGWHAKAPPKPWPLYRLDRLTAADPDSWVIIVEGEGKCEAAERLFPNYVCTAWMDGALSIRHSDWTVLRRFREERLIWWADADRPRDVPHGCFVASPTFQEMFPRASYVDTSGLETIEDGWDAADLEAEDPKDPEAWLQGRMRQREAETSEPQSEPQSDPFSVPDDHKLAAVRPVLFRAADWAGKEPPEMRWIIQDWIPGQQVTGLYGAGGSLKTWLMVQGLMAVAAGLPFLGHYPPPMPTLGVFCEDMPEEIVRRMVKIAQFYDEPLSAFADFHWISLVGVDDTELVVFDGQRMDKTKLLRWLDHTILRLRIGLTWLDTLGHVFGGDVIKRGHVGRFIRALDAVSITRDCAILFNAHTSQRGKKEGTMDSGSTAWEGGVRSRLGWGYANEGDPDATPDPDRVIRVLTRIKSNYAPAGETLDLLWRDKLGFFPVALDAEMAKEQQRGPGREAACNAKFLELLAKFNAQGRHVHDGKTSTYYAPLMFSRDPAAKPFSLRDFEAAMARLFNQGLLRVVTVGPPSRCTRNIVASNQR